MRIGITLNEVVRDFSQTMDAVYEAYEESRKKTEGTKSFDMSETSMEAETAKDFVVVEIENTDKRKILNLGADEDLFGVSSKYAFDDEKDFQMFMYDRMAFQLFGRCPNTYPEAMQDLNNLYNILAKDNHQVSLVSQERSNSKPATLLFLSQNKFMGNNIKFLYNYSHIWEIYDLIVTANPYIIASKPEGKLCFKIEHESNEDLDADETFGDLLEVLEYYQRNRQRRK